MELFYAETLSPRKACAVAKYLNSPVAFTRVDLGKGEHKMPAFLAINPNGLVPVLVDGDTRLWEADAIMCHLARVAGSDLWPTDGRQTEVMRWLSWGTQHFTRHGGALYFENMIKPNFGLGAPDAGATREATDAFRHSAQVLNSYLRGRDYLVGNALTVADFAVAVSLPYAAGAKIPVDEFPEIERWHARLEELPAWRAPFPERAVAA